MNESIKLSERELAVARAVVNAFLNSTVPWLDGGTEGESYKVLREIVHVIAPPIVSSDRNLVQFEYYLLMEFHERLKELLNRPA
jgi:hypothetical protein